MRISELIIPRHGINMRWVPDQVAKITKDKYLDLIKAQRHGSLIAYIAKDLIVLRGSFLYGIDIPDPFFFDNIVLPALDLNVLPERGIDWHRNGLTHKVVHTTAKTFNGYPMFQIHHQPVPNLNAVVARIVKQL
jgi:hypothetical protein